jgi:hypothetical protein
MDNLEQRNFCCSPKHFYHLDSSELDIYASAFGLASDLTFLFQHDPELSESFDTTHITLCHSAFAKVLPRREIKVI